MNLAFSSFWLSILSCCAATAISVLPVFVATALADETTPDFGPPKGAVLALFSDRAFDKYKLPLGPYSGDEQPSDQLEGRVREYIYHYELETTTFQAVKEFTEAVAAAGYAPRFECADRECGGFDFRFGIFVSHSPEMRVNISDFRFLSASDFNRGRHVGILISRHRGTVFAQVIEVEAESSLESATDIPLESSPAPRAKPNDARLFALARRLTEQGYAVLEGIEFRAGSSDLTDGSDAALTQVARVMSARPDLRFLVVGHTDNQGELELNLVLSKARAASVVNALKAIGVDGERLEAHGLGFLAPRALNDTEAGRALNRRVELALR